MLATQVLPDTDFEVNLENNSDSEIVGFLKAEEKEYPIKKGETKIGRDPAVCSIILENFTVSKLHAVIESDGVDETFIYDTGSTNQTKLGKKSLKPHCRYKIDDKSLITFGNVLAEFKAKSDTKINQTDLDNTPPYSDEKNKSNLVEDGDDIFELATQLHFMQPSTSKEEVKPGKFSEEPTMFKIPKPKNSMIATTSLETSLNCFEAETQCQLNEQDFSFKECNLDIMDSRIFNLSTQCQITQSSQNQNEILDKDKRKKDNEDLLNDGHDDILSSVSLHSPEEQNRRDLLKISENDDLNNAEKSQRINEENDEVDKGETNAKSCLNDSFLDITLNDLEPLTVNNIKVENDEEFSIGEAKPNKQHEKPLVIQESSDEETQIYDAELLNSSQRSEDDDLINTQPYISKNVDCNSKKGKNVVSKKNCDKEFIFGGSLNSGSGVNNVNEDFVSTQIFPISSGSKDKETEKSGVDVHEKIPENVALEGEENEDFLATQLFSGPITNFEKVNKNGENSGITERIEECEDFLATQLFSGPVYNYEKPKQTENEMSKSKNVEHSSTVEEVNESEDFLATQLFSQPTNDKKSDKVKKNETVEKINKSPNIENEDCEDFLATQIFSEPINNSKETPSSSNAKNVMIPEEEDLLETQLFSNSGNSPQKNVPDCSWTNKNSSLDKENKSCEDFFATQVFEAPATEIFQKNSESNCQVRESSPDLLCFDGRQESSQDFISTQLFSEGMVDVEPVISNGIKCEKIDEADRVTIKLEKCSDSHVSESSEDDTESDLEIITENIALFPDKSTSPQPHVDKIPSESKSMDDVETAALDDNSNSSYTFEVEELEINYEKNVDKKRTFDNQKNVEQSNSESEMDESTNKKSRGDSFWECLSLEMPSTQDVEKTLRRAHRETETIQNIHEKNLDSSENKNVKINKRTWKSDVEASEVPVKKCRTANKNWENDEKRLSRLWQDHDITEIRTSRTRRADKTPQSKDFSDSDKTSGGKARLKEVKIDDTPIAVSSSKRSSSPSLESNFSSCKRVLRSLRSLRYESSIKEKSTPTPISNQKDVPSRKFRKTSRRKSKWRVSDSCVNVVFTGLECELLDKIIRELNGKKSQVLTCSHVVVTDKVRRTVKFLCAIGLGLPIASPEWLLSSKKENEFLNPWDFILKDETSEDKWDFDLKNSLERSKKSKLLKGMSVFATNSTKPPPEDLLAIVECCGGIPIVNQPEVWPKKTIIATCSEDEEYWPTTKTTHIQIVHYECILSGVLRQKLDFRTFKLK